MGHKRFGGEGALLDVRQSRSIAPARSHGANLPVIRARRPLADRRAADLLLEQKQ